MTHGVKTVCLTGISLGSGGAEKSMAMLSQMLVDNNYRVHIAILNDSIDYEFSGELFNLGLIKNNTIFNRIYKFRKFRAFLKNKKIDCVIDHRPKNNYFKELLYDKYVYRGFERIYVVHNSNLRKYLTEKPYRFSKIYKKNKATVCVSEHIKNELINKYQISNTVTIYNAFDPKWSASEIEKPKELQNRDYILSYGRIDDQHKDLSFLIQSFEFSELWKNDVYLVILGDGKDKDRLIENARTLKSYNNIMFVPFTPTPFSYIKYSKFVSLTSRYEGFPMVLLESLALETPIISLDMPSGPSEIIIDQKNGLLIKERNVSLFSKGMKALIENDKLYLGCKTHALDSIHKFSKDEISEQWNHLLKNRA